MNQSLIKVKDEKLFGILLFELKFDLRFGADSRKLFNLLHDVNRLENLHGYCFVDGNFKAIIRKVFILSDDVTRVAGRRARRLRVWLFNGGHCHSAVPKFLACRVALTNRRPAWTQIRDIGTKVRRLIAW